MDVIPKKSLLHFIALSPKAQPDPRAFLTAAHARRPALNAPGKGWSALAAPRPCAFGPLDEPGWRWHVVLDLGLLPESSWKLGFGDAKQPAHQSHAFVFLLSAAPKATGLDRVRAALELAQAWVDAGATEIAFPAGGVVNSAGLFKGVAPANLDADGAIALLVSFALMGKGTDGRTWLRTRGMSQFGLPDLCCGLPGQPQPAVEEMEGAKTLFASVAPHLVALDRPLKAGEKVEVGRRTWRAGGAEQLKTAPAYLGDVLPFERVPDA